MHAKLKSYQKKVQECTKCRPNDLIHFDDKLGWSFPLFHRHYNYKYKILAVAEAPNRTDTYGVNKGYLTYDQINTDQTGVFFRELLASVGMKPEDIIIANSVLCLPKYNEHGKPATNTDLLSACSPWLIELIDISDPKIILCLGGVALNVLSRIERHKLTLKENAGQLHSWFGRLVLPNYHPGPNYRDRNRSLELRFADISPLARIVDL